MDRFRSTNIGPISYNKFIKGIITKSRLSLTECNDECICEVEEIVNNSKKSKKSICSDQQMCNLASYVFASNVISYLDNRNDCKGLSTLLREVSKRIKFYSPKNMISLLGILHFSTSFLVAQY